MIQPPLLVAGLGNRLRGDDGVGPWVASELLSRLGTNTPGVRIWAECQEPLRLLELWTAPTTVLLIDAVRSGTPPGTLLCVRLPTRRRPAPKHWGRSQTEIGVRGSSHALGLAAAIALGQTLRQMPAQLLVYGIQIGSDAPGPSLTPAVQRAAQRLVEMLLPLLPRPTAT